MSHVGETKIFALTLLKAKFRWTSTQFMDFIVTYYIELCSATMFLRTMQVKMLMFYVVQATNFDLL